MDKFAADALWDGIKGTSPVQNLTRKRFLLLIETYGLWSMSSG